MQSGVRIDARTSSRGHTIDHAQPERPAQARVQLVVLCNWFGILHPQCPSSHVVALCLPWRKPHKRAVAHRCQRVHVLLQLLVAGSSQRGHLERKAGCTAVNRVQRASFPTQLTQPQLPHRTRQALAAAEGTKQCTATVPRHFCTSARKCLLAGVPCRLCHDSHARCRSHPSRSARPDSWASSASGVRARMAGYRENLERTPRRGSSEARQGRAVTATSVQVAALLLLWPGPALAGLDAFRILHTGQRLVMASCGVRCTPLDDELRAGLLLRQGHDALQGHHLQ